MSSSPGDSFEQREVWDEVFRDAGVGNPSGDEWLERWTEVLESSEDLPLLELGCGSGRDTKSMSKLGLDVLATDFSEEALRLTNLNAPGAGTRLVDIGKPLPFADSSFGVVVASLSLHYFSWEKTLEIAHEIHRVLVSDGWLLARFNSTNDGFHAAAEKVELEENFYFIRGLPRRLFDRRSIGALFADGWEMESVEERTTGRFGREKMVWEVALRRRVRREL